MSLFRRRRRTDVGRYEPPPAAAPPPLEHIIDEGMIIAESAVRMTVRNALIVAALRDGDDYDAERLAAITRQRLLELAAEEDEASVRARDRSDGRVDERGVRLVALHDGVARVLRERAADQAFVEAVVDRARGEALEDVAASAIAPRIEPDPDYALRRASRMDALVAFDLAELAAERGVDLDSL